MSIIVNEGRYGGSVALPTRLWGRRICLCGSEDSVSIVFEAACGSMVLETLFQRQVVSVSVDLVIGGACPRFSMISFHDLDQVIRGSIG